MSESVLVRSGGGVDLDVVTATAADIAAPKVSVDKDGEVIAGTMVDRGNWSSSDLAAGASVTIPGGKHGGSGKVTAKSLASQTACSASDGYVYSGKTYWKDGILRTGNMAVNSVLSFSAAAYGGKKILLKWQNPYAATGKPFSGVVITYSTSGYLGAGGTQIYKGIGSNTAASGWSQVIVDMPSLGTTYYFSLRSYATCSAGDMYSGSQNSSATTAAELWLTYTSSKTYIIPTGYTKMDAFAVGGGGASYAGGKSIGYDSRSGGGGGYTKQINNIAVSGGQSVAIVVGSGAVNRDTNGGTSSVALSGSVLVSATGGYNGNPVGIASSQRGGSGGGYSNTITYGYAGQGGSDGSPGYWNHKNSSTAGGFASSKDGQGTTTRAWGSASGTLYSGGGGGGSDSNGWGGPGGAGGGGTGGNTYGGGASNGSANTGGGGGGLPNQYRDGSSYNYTSGGSGIVLLHVY